MKKCFILCGLAILISSDLRGGDIEAARALYNRTEYKRALELLSRSTEKDAPAALSLAGQSAYMLGDYKQASELFEKAAAVEPGNAKHYHWLGRAWGRRAETSNALRAPGYATRARDYFEKAVALNPKDKEAVNDLFTYYLEAPGFLGGGLDKASALASRMQGIDAAEYNFALAQIAERRKEYDKAERYLRQATAQAPKQAGRLVDLAKFLARRGRDPEVEATFAAAEKVSPSSPIVIYEKAAYFVKSQRNLPEAKRLLERYLTLPLGPDDPSREEAKKLLRSVSGA